MGNNTSEQGGTSVSRLGTALMPNKWDARFMQLAHHIAQWSKDSSSKVGSVIVDGSKRIISSGYNGFSRGVMDNDERLHNREVKYLLTIHAEHNAILFSQQALIGCTLYSTHPLCTRCAAICIQYRLFSVVSMEPTEGFLERWWDDTKLAADILKEAGVAYQFAKPSILGAPLHE